MKKVVFLLFAIVLVSCRSLSPYKATTSSVDFSKFFEMGFFITESNSVSFEYSPIGSITSYIEAGYVDNRNWKSASEIDALSLLYNKAISIGANGLINLKTEHILPYKDKLGIVHGDAIVSTGMAIKTNSNKTNFQPIENSYYTPVITEKVKEEKVKEVKVKEKEVKKKPNKKKEERNTSVSNTGNDDLLKRAERLRNN